MINHMNVIYNVSTLFTVKKKVQEKFILLINTMKITFKC